jgi:hypothetical protein
VPLPNSRAAHECLGVRSVRRSWGTQRHRFGSERAGSGESRDVRKTRNATLIALATWRGGRQYPPAVQACAETGACLVPCGEGQGWPIYDGGDCQMEGGAEACDGASLGGASCQLLGYAGGTLRCTSWCALDTQECTRCSPLGQSLLSCGEAPIDAFGPWTLALDATDREVGLAWVSLDAHAQAGLHFARFAADLTLIEQRGPFGPSCPHESALATRSPMLSRIARATRASVMTAMNFSRPPHASIAIDGAEGAETERGPHARVEGGRLVRARGRAAPRRLGGRCICCSGGHGIALAVRPPCLTADVDSQSQTGQQPARMSGQDPPVRARDGSHREASIADCVKALPPYIVPKPPRSCPERWAAPLARADPEDPRGDPPS